MATWAEEFAADDFEQRVADVRSAIDSLGDEVRSQIEDTYPGAIDQLQTGLDYTLTVVGLVNPELVAPSARNAVTQRLDEFRNTLTSIAQAGDTSPIPTIQNGLDALVVQLGSWPATPKGTAGALTKAAATFARSLEKQLSSVKKDIAKGSIETEAANQRLEELKTAIAEAEEGMRASITQARTESSSHLEDLKQSIEAEKARIDGFITQFQQQFGEAQEKRGQQFQEATKALEKQIEEFISSTHTAVDELSASMKEQAQDTIQQMKDLGQEAGALVEVITAHGTSEGYGQEASQQKKIADRWRYGAVVLAIVAGALAVFTVLKATNIQESTAHVVSRVLATVALIGVAGYAANQSGRHRRREELAKRRQLELAALEPFLRGLPDDDSRKKVREGVATRYFASPEVDSHRQEDALTAGSVSVLGQLVDVLRKLVK